MDLPESSWSWRQYKNKAGAGDLFDMTIHRIDFAIDLLGPINSVCGAVARFADRTQTADGQTCPPSEVDDWSSLIGEFASGATGVWEGTTLAKGYGRNGFGHEWAEVNGSEGSRVSTALAQYNSSWENRQRPCAASGVGRVFKTRWQSAQPSQGEPATVFRYDLMWEFVSAIVEGRDARPSFYDGLNAQIIADAVLKSHAECRWVETPLAER